MPSKIAVLLLGSLAGYSLALSEHAVATLCILCASVFFSTKLFFEEEL